MPDRAAGPGRRRDRPARPTRRWRGPSRRSTSTPRWSPPTPSTGCGSARRRRHATRPTPTCSPQGVHARLGVWPEVLSGEEEAALSFDGAVRNLRGRRPSRSSSSTSAAAPPSSSLASVRPDRGAVDGHRVGAAARASPHRRPADAAQVARLPGRRSTRTSTHARCPWRGRAPSSVWPAPRCRSRPACSTCRPTTGSVDRPVGAGGRRRARVRRPAGGDAVARAPGVPVDAPRPRRRHRRRRADPEPGAPTVRGVDAVASEADILDGIAWSMVAVRRPLPHPLTGQPFPRPCPPGTGWPDDPATPRHPGGHVRGRRTPAGRAPRPAELDARVSVCSACPRLVAWREDVAREKRASFADQPYWGRPIAGWGDPDAGGARSSGSPPAANGGNRTGRVFTGDSLRRLAVRLAAPGRAGHAADAASTPATGSALVGARMVADGPLRAARQQADHRGARHLHALDQPRARAARADPAGRRRAGLASAGTAPCAPWPRAGYAVPRPRPRFGHGASVELAARRPRA